MRILSAILLLLVSNVVFASCGFMAYQKAGETCTFYNNTKLKNDLSYNIQWACTTCVAVYSYNYTGGACVTGATSDYYVLTIDSSYAGTFQASNITNKTLPPEIKIKSVIHDVCTDGKWR